MRTKHTFRLPPDLAGKLADYAARKRVPQALVVETALASHLSPDGADRLEAALARRLDRMTRQIERLERHVTISNEALALFVRFWLTSTPPLPDTAQAAAQAKGRERYDGFVEALGDGWRVAGRSPMKSSADVAGRRARKQAGGAQRVLIGDSADRLSFYATALRPHQPCCASRFPALSNQPR